MEAVNKRIRVRLVVKKGLDYFTLPVRDIAYAFVESKIVYIVDKQCRKYMYDKNLYELHDELDKSQFFRANRQYLLNLDFIKCFKTYEKVKIQVEMLLDNKEVIIVSQENAAVFKKWINHF